MVIVLFWSRLRADLSEDTRDLYARTLARMRALAEATPGFVSHKTYTAEDGERVSLVAFDSEAALEAWRDNPEHRAAQALGRERFYEEYRVTVCATGRRYVFSRDQGRREVGRSRPDG